MIKKKHLEAMSELGVSERFKIILNKDAVAEATYSITKETAKGFDVWKWENDWQFSGGSERYFCTKKSKFTKSLTFDELFTLYEESLKQ